MLGPGPSLLSFSTRGSRGTRSAPLVPALPSLPQGCSLCCSTPTLPALAFSSSLSPTPYKPRGGLAGESLAAAVATTMATASTGPPDTGEREGGRVEGRETRPSALPHQLPLSSLIPEPSPPARILQRPQALLASSSL